MRSTVGPLPGAVWRDQRGQIWLHAGAQQRQHVPMLTQQRHGCQLPLKLQGRHAGGQIALPSSGSMFRCCDSSVMAASSR